MWMTGLTGRAYNTTIAYKPDDLSTSTCFHGDYSSLNFTKLQYPAPNSLLSNCPEPGFGQGDVPTKVPYQEATQPQLSYRSELTLLDPSWSSCTINYLGAMDPPRTLEKRTAMAPPVSSSVPAAPGSPVIPDYAPATPTPSARTLQDGPPQPASSFPVPAFSSATSHLEMASESRSQRQSTAPEADEPGATKGSVFSGKEPLVSNEPANLFPTTYTPQDDPASDGPPQSQSDTSITAVSEARFGSGDASTNDSPLVTNPIGSYNLASASDLAGHGHEQPSEAPSSRAANNVVSSSPIDTQAVDETEVPSLPMTGVEVSGLGDPAVINSAPSTLIIEGATTGLPSSIAVASRATSINIGGSHSSLSQTPSLIIIGGQTLEPVSIISLSRPSPNSQSTGNDPDAVVSPLADPVYKIGSQTITASPTSILIGGSTALLDGPAITIAGTPVRLQPSGDLVVGDSTISVLPTVEPSSLTTASSGSLNKSQGQTSSVTNPTAVSETVIFSNGAGVTIGGTLVSIQASVASLSSSSTNSTSGSRSASATSSVSKGGAESIGGDTLIAFSAIFLTAVSCMYIRI